MKIEKIGIVGLGLIGGSFAKSVQAANKREDSNFEVFGLDNNEKVLEKALNEGAINEILTDFRDLDFLILAMPPHAIQEFISTNYKKFAPDTIVFDVCGIKKGICDFVRNLPEKNFCFYGCHPMAGRECSGYESSLPTLFARSSFIVTLSEGLGQDGEKLERLKNFIKKIGFGFIKETSPEEHDKVIAYTSQLCHVVSSAYVKSSELDSREGMTAGSFRDLSRVAFLDENLWAKLFLENRENILSQTTEIIKNLSDFRDAIASNDEEKLKLLLKEGRELAEKIRNS